MQEISEVSNTDHSSSLCVWNAAAIVGIEINPCKSVQAFLLLSKEMQRENARVCWDYGVTEILVLALSF